MCMHGDEIDLQLQMHDFQGRALCSPKTYKHVKVDGNTTKGTKY